MPTSDELRKVLNKSGLSEQDFESLAHILSQTPDQDLPSLLQLLDEKPELILKLNDNLKAKRKAYADADVAEWKKIIEAEEREIQGLD